MTETDADRKKLRAALLDQLAHLTREVEALKVVIGRVPEELLSGRPLPDSLSIKESFGLQATLDAEVHRARLQRIVAEDDPRFDAEDARALIAPEDWNEQGMPALLTRVEEARRDLIEAFEALPDAAWLRTARFPREEEGGHEKRDVYEMAHFICQHDADRLRTLGQRLYESQM